jgi:hypothetical protein
LSHQAPPVINFIVAIVVIIKGIGEGGIDLAMGRGGSRVK